MSDRDTLPTDTFSTLLRTLQDHPGAVVKASTIDMVDFLGHSETWTVKTIRVDGEDVVFLQRINAEGGARWVLPREVTAALARQRDNAVTVTRKRGARQGAITRATNAATKDRS